MCNRKLYFISAFFLFVGCTSVNEDKLKKGFSNDVWKSYFMVLEHNDLYSFFKSDYDSMAYVSSGEGLYEGYFTLSKNKRNSIIVINNSYVNSENLIQFYFKEGVIEGYTEYKGNNIESCLYKFYYSSEKTLILKKYHFEDRPLNDLPDFDDSLLFSTVIYKFNNEDKLLKKTEFHHLSNDTSIYFYEYGQNKMIEMKKEENETYTKVRIFHFYSNTFNLSKVVELKKQGFTKTFYNLEKTIDSIKIENREKIEAYKNDTFHIDSYGLYPSMELENR